MPRPKRIDRYPQTFFELMERAYKRQIDIPCASEAEAVNLRAELYMFRSVLLKMPSFNPRAAYCATHVRLRVAGPSIIAEPKPSSLIAGALRRDMESEVSARAGEMKG